MAGQKKVGWNKFVIASMSLVLFLTTALTSLAPTVFANPDPVGDYNWSDGTHVKVTSFDFPQYAGDQANFTFTCSHAATKIYTCVSERGNGNGQTGWCGPEMNFSEDSSAGILILREADGPAINGQPPPTCHDVGNSRSVEVGNTKAAPTDLTDKSPTAGGATNTQDPTLQCGVAWNPLNWWMCALVLGVNAITQKLDDGINDLMTIDQKKIFDVSTETGKGYYAAWQAFRGFALAVLVIAGLIMVIAQALGLQILDAYTIKKVLPRLIVAVLGIALSWQLMKFLVVFTNDLGTGVRQIIYYPFQNISGKLYMDGGAAAIVDLLSLAAVLSLGIVGLLSFAATALLAIFLAFLVLILRQLLIVVMILVAPIAIACSILPNTQKAYKLWYESFTKALLMFPIVVAFIALGRVFAAVSIGGNATSSPTANQLIGFVAYVGGYFAILFAARFAGGAMSTIGGIANDRSRGGFDRLKKFRGNKTAQNLHAMKIGNRFRGDNIAARAFNKTTSTAATIPHAGVNPFKMKSRMQSHASNESMLLAAEYAEKNAAFQAVKGNDDFLQAGIRGKGNDRIVRDFLVKKGYDTNTVEQGVAAIRAARRDTASEVFDTAATLALPATGTAFKGGAGEMHEAIHEVAGNDDAKAARMLAQMRGGAEQARRFDLAGGGYGDQLNTYMKQFKPDRSGAVMSRKDANEHIFEVSLEGKGGAYIAGARKSAVENFAPVIKRNLDTVIAQNNPVEISRQLATLAGTYDAMGSSAPENARVLSKEVLSKEVKIGTQTKTIQAHIEDYRENANFQEMRREYSSRLQRDAMGGGRVPEGAPQDFGGPPR